MAKTIRYWDIGDYKMSLSNFDDFVQLLLVPVSRLAVVTTDYELVFSI